MFSDVGLINVEKCKIHLYTRQTHCREKTVLYYINCKPTTHSSTLFLDVAVHTGCFLGFHSGACQAHSGGHAWVGLECRMEAGAEV